jgi:hypothetical protein
VNTEKKVLFGDLPVPTGKVAWAVTCSRTAQLEKCPDMVVLLQFVTLVVCATVTSILAIRNEANSTVGTNK